MHNLVVLKRKVGSTYFGSYNNLKVHRRNYPRLFGISSHIILGKFFFFKMCVFTCIVWWYYKKGRFNFGSYRHLKAHLAAAAQYLGSSSFLLIVDINVLRYAQVMYIFTSILLDCTTIDSINDCTMLKQICLDWVWHERANRGGCRAFWG